MAKPTPEERQHMANVRAMPCLVCGARSTAHHVTGYADRIGRFSRKHHLVVPLCNDAPHHQAVFDKASNPQSVELLSHRGFYDKYGIDLYAEAVRLWEERND